MATLRNALVYFEQAIRDGSIRKASENLHVASSAISRQLLQLEYEFDVELFVRMPRGIRPTAAGEALLAYIGQCNRDAVKLKQDIARLKGGIRGTIRIAAAESIVEEILPKAMSRFQPDFPLIDFSLISGNNYRMHEELLTRDADIVCAFDVGEGGKSHVVAAINVDIGVIVPTGHPLCELEAVTLVDCSRYPMITLTLDWLAHSSIRALLDERKVPMRIISRVERISSLKKLVSAGLGIAFLSRVGLTEEIEHGRIAWLPLQANVAKPATISLLVDGRQAHPTYLSHFVEILREELLKLSA